MLHSLSAQHLGKSYQKRMIVRDVSIDVKRGEVVALLGPNGAGKTTCFGMIAGLTKPDKGIITIDEHDISSFPLYMRARLGIGYLPQEASIFRGLTVAENIMSVLEVIEKDHSKRKERLDDLLSEFAITHLKFTPAEVLSGGERRRLEIARALAAKPSYLLLDEPLAGIDPIAVQELKTLIHTLSRQHNIGILITDHNVRETLDIVDRAYVMYDGKILIEGTPKAITNNDKVRSLYLGEEYQ